MSAADPGIVEINDDKEVSKFLDDLAGKEMDLGAVVEAMDALAGVDDDLAKKEMELEAVQFDERNLEHEAAVTTNNFESLDGLDCQLCEKHSNGHKGLERHQTTAGFESLIGLDYSDKEDVVNSFEADLKKESNIRKHFTKNTRVHIISTTNVNIRQLK